MFIVVPFLNSTGLAIVAAADLRSGDFFSEKSCHYKLVVSTSFWSWLLNVSSVLTIKKIHSDNCFWFVKALWTFWWLMGVLCFLFYFYDSEISHFLCLFLMRSFVVQVFFFIFQDIVWLVKSS